MSSYQRQRAEQALRALNAVEQFLAGTFEREVVIRWKSDGSPHPKDACRHGFPVRDFCPQCVELHFVKALQAKG